MTMTPRGRDFPQQSTGLRLVGAKRLSRYTDVSTSEEVQEEMITAVSRRVGGSFIGWAMDMDVSALKTTPWERPELVYYLERPELWDVLIWQRMDRAVRSMADMADLGRYAKQHRKRLIFASGPGGDMLELDFASPMSELIMLILAFAAQLEGQTIMERNQGAAAHLQSLGRWPGGVVPYGFAPGRQVFSDGKEGWWLFEHTDADNPTRSTADIRRAMVARAIAGRNYSEIQRWLTAMEAITPKNHRALLATPPRELDPGSSWTITVVRDMLKSPIMRGYIVKRDGTTVRGVDGAPVLQGAALIDDTTWHELQPALERLESGTAGIPRTDGHELLDILSCGLCDRNMWVNWDREKKGRKPNIVYTGRKKRIFRCNGGEHAAGVPGQSIEAGPVLAYIEEQFLAHMGPFRRTQVIRVAGVDHSAEIADLEADIEELSTRLGGLRGPAADAVMGQLQGRSDRLEALQDAPVVLAREEVVEMDTTWADDWHATSDWSERREMLRAVGASAVVTPPERWRAPVEERVTFSVGGHVDPVQDALDDIAAQEAE